MSYIEQTAERADEIKKAVADARAETIENGKTSTKMTCCICIRLLPATPRPSIML